MVRLWAWWWRGCPAGVPFSWDLVQEKMNRRRPGYFPWVSARKEPDEPELLSGVFEGLTLGTPLALLVRNRDFKSEDYRSVKDKPRLGHADDVWQEKFGHADYRGGGRASGRETISRVLGGTVAEMFLKQINSQLNVIAFPVQIGPFIKEDFPVSRCFEKQKWFGAQSKEVEDFLIQKKSEGLSYGGKIEVWIDNPSSGLGQPVFRKLKSDLSAAFMSIGGCYEVSLGDKFSDQKSPSDKGSFDRTPSQRDEKQPLIKEDLHLEKGGQSQSLCRKNRQPSFRRDRDISQEEGSQLHSLANKYNKQKVYGGIRGGISTGKKIVFQLKFKPPSSVLSVAKKGRHDPCIVPRATVVVEAMAWLVIADHVLWSRQDRVVQ